MSDGTKQFMTFISLMTLFRHYFLHNIREMPEIFRRTHNNKRPHFIYYVNNIKNGLKSY